MTPQAFVDKWSKSTLRESQGSQSHFNDLCKLLGVPNPTDADHTGNWYAFEKGATKTGGGDGWADVWKRGCFAWEYKGKRKDLAAALRQLKLYQGALENPPLLIVCDMEKIEVHTSWTNMVQETHTFTFEDLIDGRRRSMLKKVFSPVDVEAFKPGRKRADLTADVAREFVTLAQNLRGRGHDAGKVAHFVNRMIFCMFAEDVELLPDKIFTKLLKVSVNDPERFHEHAGRLFAQMRSGGSFDLSRIEWFNGGLFDDDIALPLEAADIRIALNAAEQDWSNIDPSIMGTLFERGLDPSKRSQLGAHYTDPDKIMMIVGPVIIEPLSRKWEGVRAEIESEFEKAKSAREARPKTQQEAANFYRGQRQREENAVRRASRSWEQFQTYLRDYRVLDPACGSGNFLYLGLKALKDIELRANQEREALAKKYGLAIGISAPMVGPENMLGIEINPFAAELARVAIWIGEIQWMREHGFDAARNPILKPLDTVVCHDALTDATGAEYQWPVADAIVGNPPFLGGKLLRDGLGDGAVTSMFEIFDGRVAREADLVCYWFIKALEMLETGATSSVGLVSTNSIRGGANREVLNEIAERGRIFDAWSDQPWIVEGASVRVSITCFDAGVEHRELRLEGNHVAQINTDLTATSANLTQARRLQENKGVAFMGDTKGGAFDIPGDLARKWLSAPLNPNGRPNSDVLKPWINGLDVTRRPRDKWIIDFGWEMSETEASLYQLPFEYVFQSVHGIRQKNRREAYKDFWWRHVEPRQGMHAALADLSGYIATPTLSKHRLFKALSLPTLPDHQLIVIARDDDTTFGIMHSRLHEVWSLRLGTSLEDRPRYTPTTCFETYPFPEGLTPNIPARQYVDDPHAISIANAAKELRELRERWLNPTDLIVRQPEVVVGYPDRTVPTDEPAADILKKRTLTNLYNERPIWLVNAHRDLDRAVAEAYGWTDWGAGGLPDEVILERLLVLNQERANAGT